MICGKTYKTILTEIMQGYTASISSLSWKVARTETLTGGGARRWKGESLPMQHQQWSITYPQMLVFCYENTFLCIVNLLENIHFTLYQFTSSYPWECFIFGKSRLWIGRNMFRWSCLQKTCKHTKQSRTVWEFSSMNNW